MPHVRRTPPRAERPDPERRQLEVAEHATRSVAYLRKKRLILVERPTRRPKQINISFGAQRIKTRDIVIFTRQFATMINAGLPLVQSLNILAAADREQGAARTSPGRWSTTSSPATPWPTRSRKHPKAFTDLYVNMVAAGEAGGILDTILLRLATFLEKNDALVRKVKGAMIYPGVIISVAVIAIAVLLDLRDPDVRRACSRRPGMALPLPTRIVIGHVATSCIGYWWAVLARHRRRWSSPSGSTTPRRTAGKQHRPAAAQGAGARRRAPQVGRVALHPHAGHADQLRRLDPRRPRDHGQDRGQPRHPRRGHGVARSRSRAVRRSRRRWRSRRCSRRW